MLDPATIVYALSVARALRFLDDVTSSGQEKVSSLDDRRETLAMSTTASNVQVLHLSDAGFITPAFVKCVFREGFPRLQVLGVARCTNLGKNDVYPMLSKAPMLRVIEAGGSTFGSALPKQIAAPGPFRNHLRRLVVRDDEHVDTNAIVMLMESCHSLSYLDVSGTRVAGSTILFRARQHQQLQTLLVLEYTHDVGAEWTSWETLWSRMFYQGYHVESAIGWWTLF